MKITVFGGSGFLGGHIVEQLCSLGHAVTIFDKFEPGFVVPGVDFVHGDILDIVGVRAAVDGRDVVYNYAGLSDLDDGSDNPLDSISLNVLGNANIMQACVEKGAGRFVYASSIYVYSQKGGFYRCSKQASEIYLEEFSARYGLQYTILRYGTLYGPRADEHNSVYRYLKQALHSNTITCSNPEEMREYIYVRDAAKLSVDALAEKYKNQRLILSGHYYLKVGDMLKIINEIFSDEIEIKISEQSNKSNHYCYTPYSFSPKIGQKLVSNEYTDIGQGLLECLEEIAGKNDNERDGK